jgi:hypothetical protein
MKTRANELKRAFSKAEVQMTKRHMKKCSTYLTTKEMQIKTTLRFHLIPVRIATIENTNNKCWHRCGKRSPHKLLMECKLVQPLCKTVHRLLKKLKIDLPYDPAIPEGL